MHKKQIVFCAILQEEQGKHYKSAFPVALYLHFCRSGKDHSVV